MLCSRRGAVVRGARVRDRTHEVARAQRVAVGLGFETKMGVALMVVPGIALAWIWMRWDAPGGERPRDCVSCSPAALAMAVVGLAWPLLVTLTPGGRPAVDLGHVGQQHLVADLRLQRARPRRRADRRSRRWRWSAGGPGGGTMFGGATGRSGCCSPGSATRPAGCSASRSSAGLGLLVAHAAAPARSAHRLADRCRRRVPHDGGRVQLRRRHLPPVLRLVARAVRRRCWSAPASAQMLPGRSAWPTRRAARG